MNRLFQQTPSFAQLFVFIMFTVYFNSTYTMSYLYNTIYIRSEDEETPIIMEYSDSVYCCGSSHRYRQSESMKSAYPAEQEFMISKSQNGKSILFFYVLSLAASTNKTSIEVNDLDELIIPKPNEKNEILIKHRLYGKKGDESIVVAATLIAKHR